VLRVEGRRWTHVFLRQARGFALRRRFSRSRLWRAASLPLNVPYCWLVEVVMKLAMPTSVPKTGTSLGVAAGTCSSMVEGKPPAIRCACQHCARARRFPCQHVPMIFCWLHRQQNGLASVQGRQAQPRVETALLRGLKYCHVGIGLNLRRFEKRRVPFLPLRRGAFWLLLVLRQRVQVVLLGSRKVAA